MAKKMKRRSPVMPVVRALVAVPLSLAGGWIAFSNSLIKHDLELPKAIQADSKPLASKTAGSLSYYVDKQIAGRPLVLIHSINAAGSSYEMRPIFEHYCQSRPVYALDLPGFGFSERTDRIYTPELYQDAIVEFLETVVGEPADVVGLSLGCEFVARAAGARPGLFNSLAFISPSGFGEDSNGEARSDTLYDVLSFPLWARPLYDLIVSRPSIHYFLSLSFEGPVNRGLAQYDYLTSHRPGAEYAPLYFVGGQLFTPRVRSRFYSLLRHPVIVLYDRDAFVSFELLPEFVAQRDNWKTARIHPTRGLPQFDRPVATFAALDRFWKT